MLVRLTIDVPVWAESSRCHCHDLPNSNSLNYAEQCYCNIRAGTLFDGHTNIQIDFRKKGDHKSMGKFVNAQSNNHIGTDWLNQELLRNCINH